jgi:DNA-binding GntR family transcriptional regulator
MRAAAGPAAWGDALTIALTELRRLNFADVLYEIVSPAQRGARNQADLAYEALWKKVVNQELRPGDRVIDAAIAEEAGVSRTPVREAIQRMVGDGLLEALPRGARVARLSLEDAEQQYDFRTALEVFAARRAAPLVPETEVRRLLDVFAALRRRLEQPGAQYDPALALDIVHHDMRLHQMLLFHGGNSYVARALATIWARQTVYGIALTRSSGWTGQGIADHQAILHTLLTRDAEAAGEAMERHIQRVKDRVRRELFGMPPA